MKKTSKFRFLTLCLTLVLLVSAIPANAASVANAETLYEDSQTLSESNTEGLTPIEEAGITQEEALEILGLTAEEAAAEGLSFYVVDAEPVENLDDSQGVSPAHVTIPSGEVYSFPTFTFTGTNYGQYWTCGGTRMIFGIVYHSASDHNADISVYLYRWGQDYTVPNEYEASVLFLPVGETYQMNSFFNAYKCDYKFVYYGGRDSRITVVVGIAG